MWELWRGKKPAIVVASQWRRQLIDFSVVRLPHRIIVLGSKDIAREDPIFFVDFVSGLLVVFLLRMLDLYIAGRGDRRDPVVKDDDAD